MRQDDIELPNPPVDDRPGDSWIRGSGVTESGEPAQHLSWTGHRRRWTRLFWLVVSVGAVATFSLIPKATIFRPGPLSTPHAQILAGTVTSEKCGACHRQAALSPLGWLRSAGESHADLRQSDLCLDCHHRMMPENLAFSAHNLPLSVRTQLANELRLTSLDGATESRWLMQAFAPEAVVDQDNIQCASCHKEHHGADGDLLSMSNDQCQTCHSNRFDSFADSHPAWNRWPYGRGGQIAFDHASHLHKHFPSWKSGAEKFVCAKCHPESSSGSGDPAGLSGELLRTSSYENSCKVCHDESMNLQAGEGIDFVSLPILPKSALAGVESWPSSATGFADGIIPPLTELLLRSDPEAAALLRKLPGADVSRLSVDDTQLHARMPILAVALQDLIREFGQQGQTAIGQRLKQLGISQRSFQPVLRSLPPQLISSAGNQWFSGRSISDPASANLALPVSKIRLVVAGDDDLLGESLLIGGDESGDLLDEDPLSAHSSDADPLAIDIDSSATVQSILPASSLVRFGGWYRDDQRLAITYRGHGHADPVMVGMIETFAQLGDGDPVKSRFFSDASVRSCVTCHVGATTLPATWKSTALVGRRSEFTKFSHRPHLNVSALGDCVYCHKIGSADPSHHSSVEFQPLDVQTCAACHNAKAAGDNCTKCHRYHIEH